MRLLPGEVVLIKIDFHQASGGKVRPAVVLLDSGDNDFVAAPITSRPRASEFDISIQGWREAGLNTASTVRVHKLTVLASTKSYAALATSPRMIDLWWPKSCGVPFR
jgi:mRNA interferase MazF